MTITVTTAKPAELLAAIKAAIAAQQVQTWTCDKDGDLTHSPDQWAKRAWLRPHVGTVELRFDVVPSKTHAMTPAINGVYHGRFIEMLLTHFPGMFSTACAS